MSDYASDQEDDVEQELRRDNLRHLSFDDSNIAKKERYPIEI